MFGPRETKKKVTLSASIRRSFNSSAVRYEFNLFISTDNLNDSEKNKTIAGKFNYTFDVIVGHMSSASEERKGRRKTSSMQSTVIKPLIPVVWMLKVHLRCSAREMSPMCVLYVTAECIRTVHSHRYRISLDALRVLLNEANIEPHRK